jgi:hypothetical protein
MEGSLVRFDKHLCRAVRFRRHFYHLLRATPNKSSFDPLVEVTGPQFLAAFLVANPQATPYRKVLLTPIRRCRFIFTARQWRDRLRIAREAYR